MFKTLFIGPRVFCINLNEGTKRWDCVRPLCVVIALCMNTLSIHWLIFTNTKATLLFYPWHLQQCSAMWSECNAASDGWALHCISLLSFLASGFPSKHSFFLLFLCMTWMQQWLLKQVMWTWPFLDIFSRSGTWVICWFKVEFDLIYMVENLTNKKHTSEREKMLSNLQKITPSFQAQSVGDLSIKGLND